MVFKQMDRSVMGWLLIDQLIAGMFHQYIHIAL
jgi:hypothetical protein